MEYYLTANSDVDIGGVCTLLVPHDFVGKTLNFRGRAVDANCHGHLIPRRQWRQRDPEGSASVLTIRATVVAATARCITGRLCSKERQRDSRVLGLATQSSTI
eukprot:6186383-Pleurochrysis_carterae.AAC.6